MQTGRASPGTARRLFTRSQGAPSRLSSISASALDESRRHNVVELLRRLHDRFEQVILITHIESVREGLDRVLTVRYDADAGVSRVEQESGGPAFSDELSAADEYAEAAAGAGEAS